MEILSTDTMALLKNDKVRQAVRALVEKWETRSDHSVPSSLEPGRVVAPDAVEKDRLVSVKLEMPGGVTTVSLRIAST